MKLLDEIIDSAVDHNIPIATVLRRCLVLANTLKNDKLKTWVINELNGYDDTKPPPSYRVFHVEALGFFIGYGQGQLHDQPLTPSVMKDQDREWATTASLRRSVASYEPVANDPETKTARVPWPASIVARYQTAFIEDEGWVLNRAYQSIPRACFINLVETVRNKLLEFALEIRNEIGSGDATPSNPPPTDVERLVVNIIQGGQTNVYGGTIGGDVIQGTGHTVVKGDFATLGGALKHIGFTDASLDELKAALDADAKGGHKGIGPTVTDWIESSVKTLGSGVLKVGADVAEKIATMAILAFLGTSGAL